MRPTPKFNTFTLIEFVLIRRQLNGNQKQKACKGSLIDLQAGCFCVMSSCTSNVIGVSTLAQRVPTRALAHNYNGITTAMGTGTTMGSSLSKSSRRTNPRGSMLSLRAVFRPWLWPWLWPNTGRRSFLSKPGGRSNLGVVLV